MHTADMLSNHFTPDIKLQPFYFHLLFRDTVPIHFLKWPWIHSVPQAGVSLQIPWFSPTSKWDCRPIQNQTNNPQHYNLISSLFPLPRWLINKMDRHLVLSRHIHKTFRTEGTTMAELKGLGRPSRHLGALASLVFTPGLGRLLWSDLLGYIQKTTASKRVTGTLEQPDLSRSS